ncbi:MAG: hypothetical protein WB776_21760, partial [Candidatus Sulfotelmatobacter sp.]
MSATSDTWGVVGVPWESPLFLSTLHYWKDGGASDRSSVARSIQSALRSAAVAEVRMEEPLSVE